MTRTNAPLMLSVSGARGIVGLSMTTAVAAAFADAFAEVLLRQAGEPIVVLGRDTRPSGAELSGAAKGALLRAGCRVIDIGVAATPTVAVAVRHHSAAGGLVITASHNPGEWNGLKPLAAPGVAPPQELSRSIIDSFNKRKPAGHSGSATNTSDTIDTDPDATARHVTRVLKQIDVEAIRSAGLSIVLDSVNGAGCQGGRALLEKLGCKVTHLNGEPTGRFAHRPEPVQENLTDLAEQTANCRAAAGFAQDPDADRLAIVDERGRYIGEEYTLALSCRAALRRADHRTQPHVLVANLSTSRMIDDIARSSSGRQPVRVIRTPVGEAHVAEAMQKHSALIGGEGNGGVILPDVTLTRDSLSAMALVLELMVVEGRPLSELVNDLPEYAIIKRSFDLTEFGGMERIGEILNRTAASLRDKNPPNQLDTADGIRADWPEGWVHLRPSNTEPIVRLIAEAANRDQAELLIERVTSVVGFG